MPDLTDLLPELIGDAPESVYLGIAASTNRPNGGDYLYFQYWPQSLQDSYDSDYAEHQIPGGSHPLYQWIGGRGRTISFQAIFTAEVNTKRDNTGHALAKTAATGGAFLTPSAEYTTDVEAALARIRAWQRPNYGQGSAVGTTEPPPILSLCFPNTRLGGFDGDIIKVILREAPITIESWFPNGQIRVATVDLTFNEVVQSGVPSGSGTSVSFIGRKPFDDLARNYNSPGNRTRPIL